MYHFKRGPLLVAGLLLAASQPVVAEPTATTTTAAAATVTVSPNREQMQRLVPYGDLDLSSPQGMSTLTVRIRSAVLAVCPREDTRDLQSVADVRQCRKAANEGAMLQVPQLASLAKQTWSASLKP
jgi:UrcA family protein